MEFILILLAIVWVIVPIAAKNSQKKAKEEEERLRRLRQQTPQLQRVPQPMRTAPIAPTVRPMQDRMFTSLEGTASLEGFDGPVIQGELPHEAKSDLATAGSTLTEAQTSITHSVTFSSESGHAHEETSASGIIEKCPPDKAPAKRAAAVLPPTGENAFVWDVNAARDGLVMAEILGPCLALRD